jgi:3-hydroxyacyl-CoA dehydrogenase/enoyl-CoA hydratase/3-hydroxybutyryl-CoA epimerase
MTELTVDRQDGTATVTMAFGHGNRFDLARIRRLTAFLDPLLDDDDVRFLVLRSADPVGFGAGWLPTATDDEALALSLAGQKLLKRLREAHVVSIAEISGDCLGPAFELAMSCDHRLVESTPRTRLGVPEAAVGLFPAWGGMERLVKTMGPEAAIRWFSNPRVLSAPESYTCGLATHVHSERRARIERRSFIDRIRRQPHKATDPGWLRRRINSNRLSRIIPIRETVHGIAIRSMVEAASRSSGEGWAAERIWFVRARSSPCVRAHWALEQSSLAVPRLPACPARPIPAFPHTVAVAGADRGMAALAALAAARGAHLLVSTDAMLLVRRAIDDLARAGTIDAAERDAIPKRTHETDDALDRAEWLLATPGAIGHAERLMPPNGLAMVASELVEPFQTHAVRPDRVIGFRQEPIWQTPGDRPFGELACGPHSSADTAATAHRWLSLLGYRCVVGADRHGLTIRRIASAYFDEAIRLTAEGLSPKALDAAVRASGSPEGPFERMDRIGFEALVGGVRKLVPLVAAGITGQGRGFYQRRLWGRRSENVSAQLLLWDSRMRTVEGIRPSPAALDLLPPAQQLVIAIERLGLRVLNEAVGCLADDGIAGPAEIDLAVARGAGLLVGQGGPLRHCDQVGAKVLALRMAAIAKMYGPRFEPSPELLRRATLETTFYDHTPDAELIYRRLPAAA